MNGSKRDAFFCGHFAWHAQCFYEFGRCFDRVDNSVFNVKVVIFVFGHDDDSLLHVQQFRCLGLIFVAGTVLVYTAMEKVVETYCKGKTSFSIFSKFFFRGARNVL